MISKRGSFIEWLVRVPVRIFYNERLQAEAAVGKEAVGPSSEKPGVNSREPPLLELQKNTLPPWLEQ